jgi:hypothetical protein
VPLILIDQLRVGSTFHVSSAFDYGGDGRFDPGGKIFGLSDVSLGAPDGRTVKLGPEHTALNLQ